MPWKASSVMEERLRFVARLLDGEAMTEVCRDFGISRKTGYKIFDRYREHGLEALTDRSRRPVRYANQLPAQIDTLIVRLKAEKPHWGARKIRELLVRRLDGDIRVPAKSTVHAVLDRHGLVRRGGGPRPLRDIGLISGDCIHALQCHQRTVRSLHRASADVLPAPYSAEVRAPSIGKAKGAGLKPRALA
jgi:transposase